jgi:excisionase family DNA binding protein
LVVFSKPYTYFFDNQTIKKYNSRHRTAACRGEFKRGAMSDLLSTREVARLLDVNEKMVYSLITEKGLPASKVTGKWLFPRQLVERWIEEHTINRPNAANPLPPYHGLLVVAGSNDLLLDQTLTFFNAIGPDHVAVFGNLGSLGGLCALGRNLCHVACCHLLQEGEEEYNFSFASREVGATPVAVVNFCRREQGLLLAPGNPKGIAKIADLKRGGLTIANRPLGTGTRLLLDRELAAAGVEPKALRGYESALPRHIDVALAILTGRADVGLAIRPVAHLLGLEFIPLRWERFDLVIQRERFFDRGVQLLLSLLHEESFRNAAAALSGYDVSLSGRMVFPQAEEVIPR